MAITVFRKNTELTGKALSANTLASFLVAQGIHSVENLDTTCPMPHDLLQFLNRERAIGYWMTQGWLRSDGSSLYLTESGLNEVELREAGEALGATGRKKPGNVSPALIAEARQFIETGQTDEEVPVLSGTFEIQECS